MKKCLLDCLEESRFFFFSPEAIVSSVEIVMRQDY